MSKRAARTGNKLVAVAYIRVSTEDQKLGPEAQRAAIESWAAREGVQVAAWHVDAGVSGASELGDRPGLLAALGAVREHRAGLVVVAKRDRIARDTYITGGVERAVAAVGARLVSADGASNAAGVEGLMVRGMSDLFAAVEREMIMARTKAALAAKSAKGERVSGGIPYGFALAADRVHLVAMEGEQATIARARSLAAEGRSLRAAAAQLAAEGHVSRRGAPFFAAQVGRMVASVEVKRSAA